MGNPVVVRRGLCPDGDHHMVIDLTVRPDNPLYAGLGVTLVGGRGNLPRAMDLMTLNVIGTNVQRMLDAVTERREVVLTGPAPVQAYLVVFHAVVHRFYKVVYKDGRGTECTIAMHG